jgi:hypothetical protein
MAAVGLFIGSFAVGLDAVAVIADRPLVLRERH